MTTHLESKSWPVLGALVCALTFGLALKPANASAAEAPGVAVRATDPTALIGTSTGAFTLIRHGDPNVPLSVNLSIGGTAVSGVDYTTIITNISLDPGVLAYDIVVQGQENSNNPGNKTVIVTVQTNAGYQVYGKGTATVKLVDDLYDVPPPSVNMTSPSDGSVYTVPATIWVTADTSDSELPIQSVNFYANNECIGTVTNWPYTMLWTKTNSAKVAIFARVVDSSGKSGVSTPVDVIFSAGPVVTVTPTYGNTASVGVDDPIGVIIGDPTEAISSLSYYVNGKLLATVTDPSLYIDWTPTVAGTNTIKVVATDANTGKTGTGKIQIISQ